MDHQKQSTEPRTTKKTGHSSSARNPNRFKDETLDHRQHSNLTTTLGFYK